MAAGNKVKDIDKGWKRVLALFAVAVVPTVKVGVQGKEAAEVHGEITTGELAGIHEFGAQINNGFGRGIKITVPERSFIRSTYDANFEKYARLLISGAGKVVDGKLSLRQVAELVGIKAVADMKRTIASGIDPELRPSTIAGRKRQFGRASSTPLIASGQLRNAITAVVEDTPNQGGLVG